MPLVEYEAVWRMDQMVSQPLTSQRCAKWNLVYSVSFLKLLHSHSCDIYSTVAKDSAMTVHAKHK